ncbi:MAG: hypothetical protein AB1458_14650 [Bacteroidota bacterium]
MKRISAYIIILYGSVYLGCTRDKGPLIDCGPSPATFNNDILPIMITHCSSPPFASCHTWATDYGSIKLYVDQGSFQQRVMVEKNMPPVNNADSAPPLTEAELSKLRCWLSQGAPNN